MLIKKAVSGLLLSVLVWGSAYAAKDINTQVSVDPLKQAHELIKHYRAGKNVAQKESAKHNLHTFLSNLKLQSTIFGGAMDDEAMSGELEASIINEQEQVELNKAIALIEDQLASIDTAALPKKAKKYKKGKA